MHKRVWLPLLAALAMPVSAGSLEGLKPIAVGPLGMVEMNPFGLAPLTAVIKDAGHSLSQVKVTVEGKGEHGVDISYPVEERTLANYGGVPVFGLYPNYNNRVKVEYLLGGKAQTHTYEIWANQVDFGSAGASQWAAQPEIKVNQRAPEMADRLYLVNFTGPTGGDAQLAHNNPTGPGAFAWDGTPQIFVTDTQGEIRWYLDPSIHDAKQYDMAGYLMGLHQVDGGKLIFGQGQSYYKMDLLGRLSFKRPLPGNFIDFSHEIQQMPNGHQLMRVAKKDYLTPEGKLVNTIRDHIIEVDADGTLVHVWDLNTILDPYRDVTLSALDMGAVCLNVNLKDAGKQMTKAELASAPYGDIPGVGPGRNWAHVNSIDYDASDDSIIISSRHQSAVIKIGRDNQVKWILSDPRGWSEDYQDKLLTPIGADGQPLTCFKGKCQGEFDWSWTQHTAYLTPKGTLSVFDNGDGRHNRQPMFAKDKYSRAVEYRIDEQKMTVEQVWDYGQERGWEWYSPVTSIVEYQEDHDSMMVYSASAMLFGVGGGLGNFKHSEGAGIVKSNLVELKYGTDEVLVDMDINSNRLGATGYRAVVIKPEF